jgi:hypothetical protein
MAMKVGVGLSIKKDPALAVKEAARLAHFNIGGDKIDLAIVFSSINLSYFGLLKTITAYLGDIPAIGCSGLAIISNEGIHKNGIIIMALKFPEGVYFSTAAIKEMSSKTSLGAGEELGEKLLYGFKDVRRDLSIVFSDGLMQDGSSFLSGLQERLGKSFPLVGGCASDNLAFKKTYVYYNQEMLSDAACGILLGGRFNFGIGVKHGWKPLGKPRQVTKSYAGIVYEIDGKPAVNIYEDYFACDLANLKKELKRISTLYPIGIYLEGEAEYLLRNLIAIQDDGSLLFQGSVPVNSQIRLMIGTKESCLLATRQALEEVKNGLLGHKSNFVLVFDSVSRYILLGRGAQEELKIIKEILGADTQIIGLYTYGEQAPLKSINYQGMARSHNQTITILGVNA